MGRTGQSALQIHDVAAQQHLVNVLVQNHRMHLLNMTCYDVIIIIMCLCVRTTSRFSAG